MYCMYALHYVRYVLQKSDKPLTVRHFQLGSWPESSDYPAGLDVIIDLMETVEKWQQASGNSSITVHCMYVCDIKQLCEFHWMYKCMYMYMYMYMTIDICHVMLMFYM